MRAKEFVPKESNRTRFADGYLAFSDHFEDRLRERNISKSDVLRLLHKLEVTRSIDLIRMPYVSFTVKSHNLGLAFHKQLDKHGNTAYVIATAHPTLRAGEDEDVIYLEEDRGQGAAGIILYAKDTGRYGLQQRSDTINDPGQWAAWGGGREPGESLEQCAVRELGEESGYTGSIKLKFLDANPKYTTFIGIVPHEFEPRANDEWKDYCWVEAGDWPSPMHPGVAAALKNIAVNENFADGKVKGKSRPGRVKRAGASCDGSVSDLRAKARKYGGEKGKMYHWCANMKGGKKKANEDDESYDGPYDGHNFGGAQIG